ncbi:signal peptidase I [Desulfovirgula thermocuniculi]|uniref:signal peptidase I n=1 Tax=Desulfovirgula thermocuniculi TaxID=348842 RepID=UPI0003FE306C|nr:signal peptidase I [Desulfovirgula thermocuniculi]
MRERGLLGGLLLLIYVCQHFLLRYLGLGPLAGYLLVAALWAATAAYTLHLPRHRPAGRLRLRRLLCYLAGICAGFYILFHLAAGLVEGFGRSPYSFSATGILVNLTFVSALLAGTELSRAHLACGLSRRRALPGTGALALLFTALALPPGKVLELRGGLELARYAGETFLPALAENALACYLARLGGPAASLCYRAPLAAFQWFCPVLPNPGWATRAVLGTLLPVAFLAVIQRLYLAESGALPKSRRLSEESPAGWVFTSIASVLLIWFSLGLFPVYPSLILSGSMEPGIKKGDIVLVRKVGGEAVKPGDIIQFRQEGVYVTHRVVEVVSARGEKAYRTRGDANNAPDPDPVLPRQVRGRVIGVIPKVGWVPMTVKAAAGLVKFKGGFGEIWPARSWP